MILCLAQDIKIPNEFELVIKHSKIERFSADSKLVEVFKMNIDNYNVIKQENLKITFEYDPIIEDKTVSFQDVLVSIHIVDYTSLKLVYILEA